MKVFVISLPDSGERRRSAQQQLDRAGVPFEFFDAIRGDIAIRDCIFEGFDETSYLLNTGRHAVIGEIGCFASHRELWRHCVELNEPLVILEDDFNVLPRFKNALRAAANIIDTVGFVRLQTTLRAKQAKIAKVSGFQLGRFVKAPHGMMCYCLSPKVARHFLEETRIIHAPVDVFMKKYWEHGQPLYALTPFTIAPSVLSVETTIEDRNKGRKSFRTAQRRFRRKANWYLRRWIFNLRMRFQRSPVGDKPVNRSDLQEPVSSSR
tara:strand:- start:11128 stop:11922 length:795 start_codon:yes stop_codon:yes gene_type:complete